MKARNRFVFDTNVVISAILFSGSQPGIALKEAFRKGVVVFSQDTFEELRVTALKEKFNKYAPLPDRLEFLKKYTRYSTLIKTAEKIKFSRDPDDDKFLSLAIAARATAIVSGDDDLLSLTPFRNIPIVSPADFLTLYG